MLDANRKIKIIYQVTPYIIGGTERFLFNLIKHLDREIFEPVIFSFASGMVIDMFKRLNIEIKIINTNYLKKIDNLVNFLKKSKVDIAHSNHFYPVLAIAANLAKIPHIWYFGSHIYTAHPELNSKYRRYYLNTISFLSKEIICPSKFIKQQFENIGDSRIRVIYDGIDFDEIDKICPDYTALKKYIYGSERLVGMVAHLIPQKRHMDFMLAARIVKKRLPNIKFFIMGAPYPSKKSYEYAKSLIRKARLINMDKDIIFLGFCKNVLKTIASMELIVLPSIGEGSSNAIKETMALGKPVVASDSGGNSELVKDKITGLLAPPKNPERLAEAIIEILENPKKAGMMGDAGRKRAKRLFDIRKVVHQYEKIYQKVYSEPFKP